MVLESHDQLSHMSAMFECPHTFGHESVSLSLEVKGASLTNQTLQILCHRTEVLLNLTLLSAVPVIIIHLQIFVRLTDTKIKKVVF